MENKTIYDLKLHESITNYGQNILRVYNGWIYTNNITRNVVFVPYNQLKNNNIKNLECSYH